MRFERVVDLRGMLLLSGTIRTSIKSQELVDESGLLLTALRRVHD
jgi:hypothetical protein